MKKILGFLFLCISVVLLIFFILGNHAGHIKTFTKPTPPFQKTTSTVEISDSILFVPYWTLNTSLSWEQYQELVYFGVTANDNGIDTKEDGYKGIAQFVNLAPDDMKTLLVLRMVDTSVNEKVLQDKNLQAKLIQQTIAVAKANSFDGIVLDLEYNALSFSDVVTGISKFSVDFANSTHQNNLSFYQTLFGDTFFRARPYNVGEIAKNADGIFVMSYDFHKANGTPGPNFPLTSRVDADYSFIDMLHDFSKDVPKEKVTIVFGMFGYDWTVDEKERTIGQAKSLSEDAFQEKFATHCLLQDCKTYRDRQTQEPSASYIDENGQKHLAWWEDMQSLEKKKDIMRHNGISKISFWANGYF